MKFLILALAFVSVSAQAGTVYNVQLGQSASLQSGDVAIVSNGGTISSISCGGPATLPSRQQFESSRAARFSDLYQSPKTPDISRQQQCSQYSAEQQIRQALTDALVDAREACFQAGFTSCQQPQRTDEQYSFRVYGYPGSYACQTIARIIGTR